MDQKNDLQQIQSFSWEQLVAFVNNLITNDFNQLLLLLYRLDISETKLKQTLASDPDHDAAALIAQLIIERQEEKKKSREEFGRKDWSGSEEERW